MMVLWMLFFLALLAMSAYYVLPVGATPCAVLKVSLPDGFYHGDDVDNWLDESYLLNLTGAVQTFVVRINNTSASLKSYDTRLVIALNDAGYNNLVSLVVNGTSVLNLILSMVRLNRIISELDLLVMFTRHCLTTHVLTLA